MGAYDCDCINNLEYDRRERKQKEQSRSTAQSTARSTAQSTDLIDRQAAIDGKIVIQRTNGVEIYSDEAVPVEYLKNLPSRQPEPSTNCSEIPNSSDTISRQAAIDALVEWYGCEPNDIDAFKEIVEALPSAQPEIIHCKECKYGVQDEDKRWYCRGLGCQVGEADGSVFCADAERRTDGGLNQQAGSN